MARTAMLALCALLLACDGRDPAAGASCNDRECPECVSPSGAVSQGIYGAIVRGGSDLAGVDAPYRCGGDRVSVYADDPATTPVPKLLGEDVTDESGLFEVALPLGSFHVCHGSVCGKITVSAKQPLRYLGCCSHPGNSWWGVD